MSTRMTLMDTVGDWVTAHPVTSRVFEQHRIDYCCGGGKSLEEACWSVQADVHAVLAELSEVVSRGEADDQVDFTSLSLAEMCDEIEAVHHQYLKRELPRLTELVEKVLSVHGDQHSWLTPLAQSFHQVRAELVPHMLKEEQILFPAIRKIERVHDVPSFPFGSLENPIRMMEHEHDTAGRMLREIRTASSDFKLPEGGCNTFRAMLDGLRELEADLHQHIHKENNILFPGASQLADELNASSSQGGEDS